MHTTYPAPYTHSDRCRMQAFASATENARDAAPYWDSAEHTPTLAELVATADGYLADGTASCTCTTGYLVGEFYRLDDQIRDTRRTDADPLPLIDAQFLVSVQLGHPLGESVTWRAVNGHVWESAVSGFYPDGSPRAPQWSARHADSCDCHTWDGDRSIPDW